MFVEKEIKEQTVISVENNEEKIIAFLNVIPDYVKNEGTYDLLRKTADAPNGILDFIMNVLDRPRLLAMPVQQLIPRQIPIRDDRVMMAIRSIGKQKALGFEQP